MKSALKILAGLVAVTVLFLVLAAGATGTTWRPRSKRLTAATQAVRSQASGLSGRTT